MLKQSVVVVTVLAMASQGFAAGSADGANSNTRVGIGPNVGTGTKSAADNSNKDNGKGAKVAQIVSIGFAVAGAAAAAQCPGACSYAPALFAMSMIAGMVSQSNKKTKEQAGATDKSTDGWGNSGYGSFDPYGRDDLANLTPAELEQLKTSQNAMQALTSEKGLNGIKFDPKTGKITGADGKVFKVSDFDSPASMKAAGYSDSFIKGAMDKAAKLEAEALAKVGGAPVAAGFEDGGGGAPSSVAAGNGVDDGSDKSEGGGGGRGGARNPAAGTGVAGLSKDYNGDPIGVAQDELFLMMTRRYKVKEKQDSFFTEAELIKK